MALSSRPSVRIGLPATPAPRSRSLSRTRQPMPDRESIRYIESNADAYIPSRAAPTPPPVPQLRKQLSIADLRPGPSRRSRSVNHGRHDRLAPPPPPLPVPSVPLQREEPAPSVSPSSFRRFVSLRKRSDGSVSSWASSSSGSSISQNSLHSPTSYASSRTSLAEYDKADMHHGEKEETASRFGSASSPSATENGALDGYRTAFWNKVASAADNLRVNVNKALGTTVSPDVDEETPLGQESRLTRAMKAYHLKKARDANDLPDWLFDGRDREVINRLRNTSPTPAEQMPDVGVERGRTALPHQKRSPSVAHRDDSVSAWRPSHSRASSTSSVQSRMSVHATTPSRDTMNRLKELRLAKRNARVRFADDEDGESDSGYTSSRGRPSRVTRNDAPPSSFRAVSPPPPGENPILRRRPTGYRPPLPSVERKASGRVGLPSSVRLQTV
ncbi:uncharacterized protein LAESUDRAFT_755033 [Laetiporus sulphureus 93-53]|uniref:Uncharacterized protein n=1 Tax=Laetiporus sulphureus 93-53 TaxID=1314785 RepID=A0A165H834_9APHY|nr:uncharacterized protein LAESUDRAFT_755033 [Laetiporus sulphureus 93-53]KZT11376.1 hypothetical protein LAESUDRAFT_755033 [Laetiporus sulphureus 93-53]